jgi:hypothetical protein
MEIEMSYTKVNGQIKKITSCFINTSEGIKKLTRIITRQGGEIIENVMSDYFPTLGDDKAGYGSGIIVFEGRGILFTEPKAHSFRIPLGVSKVHMVAIGAGGSGGLGVGAGSGGGGGGLAAVNNVDITPGQNLTINVGRGGQGYTSVSLGESGQESSIVGYIKAFGGQGGLQGNVVGGAGGSGEADNSSQEFLTLVIGRGGQGGISKGSSHDGSGGGGAAGYGGIGGKGGGVNTSGVAVNGSNGQKGGGGGGGSAANRGVGGHGGGVSPFGLGMGGSGAINSATAAGTSGGAGSINSSYSEYTFGGGSGGVDHPGSSLDAQDGAILILWGEPLSL